MPNIATMLKQEITRLARKEARAQTSTLQKANAQYRRDIAELKRQTAALSKQVAFLEKQESRRTKTAAPNVDLEGRRFSRRGLRTHRKKVGLSAADYAKLVGVTGQTIYGWEQGKSRPRDQQLAKLLTVRGLGKRDAEKRLALLRA